MSAMMKTALSTKKEILERKAELDANCKIKKISKPDFGKFSIELIQYLMST